MNFYPFKETLRKTKESNKIIENIDIGGPTMVRAAAKNFHSVTIITDKLDYHELVNQLKVNKGKQIFLLEKKWREKHLILLPITTYNFRMV